MNENEGTSRGSSIAAALDALMAHDLDSGASEDALALFANGDEAPPTATREEIGIDPAILDACRHLAAAGTRPGVRNVTARLKQLNGITLSRALITAAVRSWRASQWKSEEVRTAFRAYALLNAEQRAAFSLRAAVDDESFAAHQPEDVNPAAPYEIRIEYRGMRTRVETADRATIAWVKFQNIVDRRRADVTRIDLFESTPTGPKRLRGWKTAGCGSE